MVINLERQTKEPLAKVGDKKDIQHIDLCAQLCGSELEQILARVCQSLALILHTAVCSSFRSFLLTPAPKKFTAGEWRWNN